MNTDAVFEALNKLATTPGEGRLPKAFALLDLLDQLSFKSENFNVDKAYDFGHDLRSAKISFGILEGYVPPDSQEAFPGEEIVDQGDGEAELKTEGDYDGDPENDSELVEAAAPVDESEILLETLERMRALTEP